jgi:hypothetical protein
MLYILLFFLSVVYMVAVLVLVLLPVAPFAPFPRLVRCFFLLAHALCLLLRDK